MGMKCTSAQPSPPFRFLHHASSVHPSISSMIPLMAPERNEIIYICMKVIHSFLCLILISAFLRRTLSNHYDSESERHPEVIGAVAVAGIAVAVDKAGIGRIATIHGQKPPVGPASAVSSHLYSVSRILEDL